MANNIGGVLGAMNYVQAQGALGKQQGEERLTRRLSDQTIGGDPNAYRQLAAMDPAAANAAQGAGDNQLRRMKGLVDFMEKADASGNPEYAQQAWAQYGVPYVRQFAQGTEPTANWAEAKPMVAQLKARLAMAEAGNPSSGDRGVVVDGNIVDPNTGRVIYQGNGEKFIQTDNGLIAVGPNGAREVRLGQSAPQTPPNPADQAPYIDPTIPPEVQAAIRANPQAAGAVADGGALPMPQSGVGDSQATAQDAGRILPAGTAARQAAAEAQARQQALQNERAARADDRAERADARADAADKRAQAAQAVTGKRPTEDQNKSAGYALRIDRGLQEIAAATANDPGANQPGLGIAALDILPDAIGNYGKSDARQRVEAAQLDMLDAALTLNTGAAYTKEQLRGLSKSYFPQPGDSAQTVEAKKVRLQDLIQTARMRARDALPQDDAAGGQGGGGSTGAPQAGAIEDGYRFKGGDPSNPENWEQI